MFNYHFLTSFFLMMFLSVAILIGPCKAQITTDGSLGPAQNLPGPDYQITPDLGQQRGGNLFHSFRDFNLQASERATFSGSNSVQNVISRVTGGYSSYLDGTIRSLIPNANFYFLNPYGVFMGPNAKLEVNGAFHLSSTDSLVFADGYQFDAYTAKPLLTVAAPERFGFLNQIGNIRIEGNQLENGEKDFLVTAGNLQIVNSNITTTTRDGRSGNILLQAAGSIEIIGSAIVSQTEQGGIGHTGNITLVSPQIYLDNYAQMEDGSIIKLRGVQVGTRTQSSGTGGDVQISAAQVLLIINDSAVFAETKGSGSGGNVTLEAAQLFIAQTVQQEEGVKISARTYSQGQSGTINVEATDSISIQGNPQRLKSTFLTADTKGQGNGGNIVISTPDLTIDAGLIQAAAFAEGNAGNITLKVDHLTLSNGAKLEVSSKGKGQAGDITITGLSIDIVGESGDQPSGISSSTFSEGDSGTIRISAKKVNLDQRGTIQTQSLGAGKAGDIILNVQDLTIKQGADIDASSEGTNPEKGGDITIQATGTVFITAEPGEDKENKPVVKDGYLGGIYAVAGENAGAGGDVTLSAKELIMREGGAISLGSQGFGNAGQLTLSITDNLQMNNAAIITRATKAGGGNIEIRNLGLFTLDNSELLANAYAGDGGYIDIKTPQFKVLGDSQIDVSSQLGFNGALILNSIKLRDDFLILAPPGFQGIDLSLDRCAGLTRDTLSQFIITIRDVLPPSPTDLKTHYFFP